MQALPSFQGILTINAFFAGEWKHSPLEVKVREALGVNYSTTDNTQNFQGFFVVHTSYLRKWTRPSRNS